jgi:DUF4097 and DUF4098 domain-containing protein YvlB
MNNILKKILLWGSMAGLAGLLVCLGVLFALGFDFARLDTTGTNAGTVDLLTAYTPDQLATIRSIDIDGASCDVTVRPDPNGKFRVEYDVPGYVDVTATLDGDRLVVVGLDTLARQPWYKHIQLNFRKHTGITVYLPMVYTQVKSYDTMNICTTSGDITILPGLTAENAQMTSKSGDMDIRMDAKKSLAIESNSGDVKLSTSETSALSVTTDSGDMNLSYVSVNGSADLRTDSGEISSSHVTIAGSLMTTSDSGDLDMILTEAAFFTAKTGSGDIALAQGGGTVTMLLQTGSGDVDVMAASVYDLYVSTGSGKVKVEHHRRVDVEYSNCKVFTGSGDINIR